jgi:hypothetical protein
MTFRFIFFLTLVLKPHRRKIKIEKKIKVNKGNQNCNFIELERATPFLLLHQDAFNQMRTNSDILSCTIKVSDKIKNTGTFQK